MLDSNSNPAGVTYPIPGNDDAGRAISLYCDLMARAAIEGISVSQSQAGFDIGAAENPVVESLTDVPDVTPSTEAPDDLSLINGISPALKKKLEAEGVTSLKQVAEWTADRVAELDEKLKLRGRVGREEWMEQARDLLAGKPPRERTQKIRA